MSSKDIRRIDARVVKTIRSLRTSNVNGIRSSMEKQKVTEKKPFSSSSNTIRKNNISNLNDNNHPPATANSKIFIDASDRKENPGLERLKMQKQKYFERYKQVCIILVLNDKDISTTWKEHFTNLDVSFIEKWLQKFLFNKNFFIFKIEDAEKGIIKVPEGENKVGENIEATYEIKEIIKEEIIKIITSNSLDITIDERISSLENDFNDYTILLNNFSYK